MSLRHWLQLAMTDGIGPILIARLVQTAGGAEGAANADAATLREVEGIGSSRATTIAQNLRRAAADIDAELARVEAAGAKLICLDDPDYPPLLRDIPDPPPVLYVRGSIEPRDLNAVAIVGSRKCSFYGREQAERFGALLAGAGVTVVSGGARGIDTAAHRGALSHPNGRTIAVLGSGVDVAYPPENAALFEQIAQTDGSARDSSGRDGDGRDGGWRDGSRDGGGHCGGGRGAVISEYPMRTPPAAENFPRRNRIVSGLSRGVLVVEADERSGALITARQACDDHGRPVFALPGRVDNKLSVGPHRLIRDGATLVTCLQEILEGLGPLPDGVSAPIVVNTVDTAHADAPDHAPDKPQAIDIAGLNDRQRAILGQLDGEPIDVDLIIERTALPARIVLQELTLLTLKGAVRRAEGQKYAKR